nr:hypothetical protein [uncultured Pseudomonas sp.]
MVCPHLAEVERALLLSGAKVTFRGQAWSENCREWLYVDAYLDLAAIRQRYRLDSVVEDHRHRGTHDGQEQGLVCSACHDALIGLIEPQAGKPVFPGAA